MIFAILFFSELLLLFALSKTLTNLLSSFYYRLTRSKKVTIYLLSFLFLPGTLIHEMSHFIMALILRVPVGELELVPKLIDGGVKMGSVKIAKTDPFRRILIGTAPILTGTLIILGLFFYGSLYELFGNNLFIFLTGYLVFEVGNTMFSSKKDMEGALKFFLFILVVGVIFYLIGVRFSGLNPSEIFMHPRFIQIFQKASLYLLAPIGIDAALILLLKIFRK